MVGVVTEPSEPPASGPAVEQPPHGLDDRPRTTVYPRGERHLWVYWPSRWQLAEARAKQVYADGRVIYQVELYDDPKVLSKISRAFLWGPDNIRAA